MDSKTPKQKSLLTALCTHPLFADCEATLMEALAGGCFQSNSYAPGDLICSPETHEKQMLFLLAGSAAVYSADAGRSLLLRRLSPGDITGVSNLFSEEPFVSRVIAEKRCTVLSLSAAHFGKMLEKDPVLLRHYISFLSERIRYLNRKILFLTAGSAERKLAHFLDSATPTDEDRLTLSMNSLCEMLDLGRASLYRAADTLESEGFIAREGKTIKLLDRRKMLDKYK